MRSTIKQNMKSIKIEAVKDFDVIKHIANDTYFKQGEVALLVPDQPTPLFSPLVKCHHRIGFRTALLGGHSFNVLASQLY